MTPEQIAKNGTEHSHQAALFAWCALNVGSFPDLEWFHSIPNGGLRDKITAGKLKAEGVKRGVSDTFLPVKRGPWSGLYIEMKRPGEKATKEQKTFGSFVLSQGYGFIVCDHWEKARDILIAYLTSNLSLQDN
jgi:hypothetical protein